nr:trithorax group protein osa-like [Ipomoea batatas]
MLAWRSDTDPGSNTEHNSIGPVSEKNFAGSELKTKRVLLLSLQKGGRVTFPGPNLGHNSVGPIAPSPIHNHPVSTFSEKNIASSKLRSQQDLLPSLQKGGPVTSPGPNRGHNSAPIPSPNPVSTFNKKNSVGSNRLRSHKFLLPSLQKGGTCYFSRIQPRTQFSPSNWGEKLCIFENEKKPYFDTVFSETASYSSWNRS